MAWQRQGAAVTVVSAFGLATVLAAAAIADATHERAPSPIKLREPLPEVVRIAQRVTVSGRVRHPSRGAQVGLELERTVHWRLVASTGLRGSGAFSLRWRVSKIAPGPVQLRLALSSPGRPPITTAPVQSAIGPAAVYCKPPVPPAVNIPPGYGWITGGVYGQGGPFPGIFACSSSPYTVTAANSAGAVAASETVPALSSYTLVVPAGSYMLQSGDCRGTATVLAGRGTKADTDCDYP